MVSSVGMGDLLVADDPAGRKFMRFIEHGDVSTLDELLSEHVDRSYSQARRLLGQNSEAEDAVQDAFIRLILSARRYDLKYPFAAWLGRIVHVCAVDVIRARRRRARKEADAQRESQKTTQLDPGQSEHESAAVRAAVQDLPERYRATIELHYFAGLSQGDTAKALGVKENTVAVRLHRARECLRSLLQRRGVIAGETAIVVALAAAPSYAAPTSVANLSAVSLAAKAASVRPAWFAGKFVTVALAAIAACTVVAIACRQMREARSTYVRQWHFDSPGVPEELEGFSSSKKPVPTGYHSVPSGGFCDSGCLESDNGVVLKIHLEPLPLPVMVSWKVQPQAANSSSDRLPLDVSVIYLGDQRHFPLPGYETFRQFPALKNGEWADYRAYVTARSVDLWRNDQRVLSVYRPPQPNVFFLSTNGPHRLDELSIRSLSERDIPDFAQTSAAIDQVERALRKNSQP